MKNLLYSVVLELSTTDTATMPATMGHLARGLFLDLIKQVDLALSSRLHDEPGYRPFTLSPPSDAIGEAFRPTYRLEGMASAADKPDIEELFEARAVLSL